MAQAGTHSAAGQMIGYLYQCELALLELAERSWDDPAAEVRMEVLDDIEFLHGSGTPAELLQSKHRGAAGQLSETGKDFWRSVASWIDALNTLGNPGAESMPLLRLVTTQVAAEGTFYYLLRRGDQRDVPAALARMEEVAAADAPKTTADERKMFLDLSPSQRYRFVDALVISDGAPVMSDLDPSLAKAMGIRANQHDAVLDQIKGWWYRVAVRLLERKDPARRRASVSAQELLCRLDEVSDQFAGENLPITEELRRLTTAEIAAYNDDLVVAQMRWIGLKDRRIATYLRDYHHARAQRSEWLRTFKITEDGLADYEQRLWDEWDHIFGDLTDDLDDDSDESDKHAVGKDVLRKTMDKVADEPARLGSNTVGWVGRGTMHSLADRAESDEGPGWHPDFSSLCQNRVNEQEK
ncbi:ABC-three component system protein [Streptomyces phaeochromogenes]|uniref:ABC-three component system protein n=1 Tax=Streptomyces phaeochromogenes TaxID=1923 RepID=UPI00197CD2DE|nr:ABC-three component system protein [Streptomyces phaeochromogenes]